jgi:hypothetical protein
MLKFSLIVLFITSMATLTVAASHMPVPPDVQAHHSAPLLASPTANG